MPKTILILFGLFSLKTGAQQIEQFYYLEPETKNLPVYIRGKLKPKTVLLYIQGGIAQNGINFGRSDYPNWKNSQEEKVAIAYYDERGLNRRINHIDTSKINESQVLEDILCIAQNLKDKYQAEVYLLGHSLGEQKAFRSIAPYPPQLRPSELFKSGR